MGYAKLKIENETGIDNAANDQFVYIKTFPPQSILEVIEVGEGVTIGKCKPFWAARRLGRHILFATGLAMHSSYGQKFEQLRSISSHHFCVVNPFYDEAFNSAWSRAKPQHCHPIGYLRFPAEKWTFSEREDALYAISELNRYTPRENEFQCELQTYNSEPYPSGLIFPSEDCLRVLSDLLNPITSKPGTLSQTSNSRGKGFARAERRKVTPRVRRQVFERDGFKCVDCGRSPQNDSSCILHVDHRLAIANGGTSVMDNLQTLCDWCNLGKKTDLDWKLK